MSETFSSNENILLRAKNPEDYINKSLKSNISPGRKAYITRLWLKKTGYTAKDLAYCRNRHPYWKAQKLNGNNDRIQKRLRDYNFSKGRKQIWDEELLDKFLKMNKKDRNNNYLYKDRELAQYFHCSIATIQHMRRKYNMAIKYISRKIGKVTQKRLLHYLRLGEGSLRKMLRAD